ERTYDVVIVRGIRRRDDDDVGSRFDEHPVEISGRIRLRPRTRTLRIACRQREPTGIRIAQRAELIAVTILPGDRALEHARARAEPHDCKLLASGARVTERGKAQRKTAGRLDQSASIDRHVSPE